MPRRASQPAARASRPTRRSARQPKKPGDDIPEVYGDMLADAVAEEQASASNSRATKRRKISEEPSTQIELDFDLFGSRTDAQDDGGTAPADYAPPKIQQVVFDDFEDSDESDAEFEDVDLEATTNHAVEDRLLEQKTLELDLSKTSTPRRAIQRRKPVSLAERKLRLDVHKAHLVFLLAHLNCRNRWCNSEFVHSLLKPLVPRKVISLLHVDESKPQYQRSHSFNKGIEEVCALWRQQWKITARGMKRAHWREDVDAVKESDDAEDLVDFDDFKAAAVSRSGSRDLGAQLFCALLRSVAVDARLVCSLQVLPFSGIAKGQTPEKPKPQYIYAPPQNFGSGTQDRNVTTTRERTPTPKKKRIVESPFPIFWVEVLSPSVQTWIPLDPLVRNTINKPKTGFEPPASDQLNSMTYVIAFEDDDSARDVTRRYTQWYNAKTRKQRVESTKGGDKWWEVTMNLFQKPFSETRDEIEDASLLKRAESEPMPKNIQDFRGHPVYVLERHLRLNEVIHPRHEVGKVSSGPLKAAKLESVFRRRDVHVCRTADAWYRRGRDVNEGEQPLKRVVPKRQRNLDAATAEDLDDEDEAQEGMALYAEFQTSLYEPPPVVDEKIPRNAYGNLDVYVPSMIPAGAVHIRHPLASAAARVLEINYADAVTGFQFKGRQGTAVIDGVVVSMNMTNAMINVIEGLEAQATEEVQEARTKIILAMWKRWLTALRVHEHVHRQYGNQKHFSIHKDANAEEDTTYRDEEDGGGFMLDQAELDESEDAANTVPSTPPNLKPLNQLLPAEVVHQDVIVVRSPNKLAQLPFSDLSRRRDRVVAEPPNADESGGFLHEADDAGGGFISDDDMDQNVGESQNHGHAASLHGNISHDGGGRFIFEEDNAGGGFLPEDEDGDDESQPRSRAAHGDSIKPEAVATLSEAEHTSTEERLKDAAGAAENATAAAAGDSSAKPRSITAEGVGGSSEDVEPSTHSKHIPDAAMALSAQSLSGTATLQPKQPTARSGETTSGQGEGGADHARDPALQSPGSGPGSGSRSGSASIAGSLLSHDPEDDDAEPEWLLSSLGEMD
ncbi:Rad4 beta-hairpin domain-containing protein [Cladophialophora immunda]|nr:Rad4 beta-hairpin domain-containing protein [Cladophialophora immunda]